MTKNQFQHAARYNILNDFWHADEIQRKNLMYMYTLCEGNWKDFCKVAELGHYY